MALVAPGKRDRAIARENWFGAGLVKLISRGDKKGELLGQRSKIASTYLNRPLVQMSQCRIVIYKEKEDM